MSRPASFLRQKTDRRRLPKIDSTKSRLQTRFPGREKKRTSIVFRAIIPRHGRRDHRPQQQRDHHFRFLARTDRVGQFSSISRGRVQRGVQHVSVDAPWARRFCPREPEARLRRCGRTPFVGAAIVLRIVEHAPAARGYEQPISDSIVFLCTGSESSRARAVAVQRQRVARKVDRPVELEVGEMRVEKPPGCGGRGRAEVIRKLARFLAVILNENRTPDRADRRPRSPPALEFPAPRASN